MGIGHCAQFIRKNTFMFTSLCTAVSLLNTVNIDVVNHNYIKQKEFAKLGFNHFTNNSCPKTFSKHLNSLLDVIKIEKENITPKRLFN